MTTPIPCGCRLTLLCTVATALSIPCSALAIDNVWDNQSGDFNYNTNSNWDNTVNPVSGLVPAASYDEVAVISNGNAVFLNTLNGEAPAGLDVRNGSSLELIGPATLNVVPSSFDPVSRPGNVNSDASSSLLIRSGSTLTVSNQMSLGGVTQVNGPAANVTTQSLNLLSTHQLKLAITSPSPFAPIEVLGQAALAGSLALSFQSFTPASGNSWVLLDAASLQGEFSEVTTSNLPLGRGVNLSTQAGGNGTQLVASISNRLVLAVDLSSGNLRIRNLDATTSESMDGYRILSSGNALNVAGWTSLDDANLTGWEEANAASNHLGELNLDNSISIAPGGFRNLGNAYVPPAEFGETPEPLVFEYSTPSGEVRTGSVDLPVNNLVLQIDPASGQAQIVNQSGYTVALNSYRVTSAAGSLDTNAWAPLADGDNNWDEANPSAKHLGELNLSYSTTLQGGASPTILPLGELFSGGTQDLVFEFSLSGGVSLQGDFNNDGTVNLADYTLWRDNLGAPAGTLDNDSSNLPIGATQYSTWKSNFGSNGGTSPSGVFMGVVQYVSLEGTLMTVGASTVPEPATGLVGAVLMLVGFGWYRSRGGASVVASAITEVGGCR